MITGYLIGDKSLVARLRDVPNAVKREVDIVTQKLGFELEARVKRDKLTGQVLKVRTGRLRASITHGDGDSRSRFESTATTSSYFVGTNVSYGAFWEQGIPAHDIVAKGKALRFTINGQVVFRKKVHIPTQAPRKFLEPALFEMGPLIIEQYNNALVRGMRTLSA